MLVGKRPTGLLGSGIACAGALTILSSCGPELPSAGGPAKQTPSAISTSAPAVVPQTSATTSAAASAAGALPPCTPATSYPPVSFVSIRRTDRPYFKLGRLQFATPDAELAPSLLAVQEAIDRTIDERVQGLLQQGWPDRGWCGDDCMAGIGCEVVRNDGEFLSVVCGAVPPHYGDTWSVVARRTGERFTVVSIGDVLPLAGSEPATMLSDACEASGQNGDDGGGLAWWTPLGSRLRLHFIGNHPSEGNCWLPWATVAPWHGCSSLTDSAHGKDRELDGSPDVPLAIALGPRDGYNPYSDWVEVWSSYRARALLARTLRKRVDDWLAALKAASKAQEGPAGWCRIYTSTGSIISIVCGSGATGPRGGGFNYRLGDAQPIGIAELLGTRPTALREIAKRCLGPFVGKGREDLRLPTLPTLTSQDLETFGLMQNAVAFELVWEFPDNEFPQSVPCVVPYTVLGTNLAALGKIPR